MVHQNPIIWLLRNIDKDKLDALAKTIPMGKIADAADAASAMEFLIKNEYMTNYKIHILFFNY